jgi:dTDP-4-dehydrorhamnose 3,5-epimerase
MHVHRRHDEYFSVVRGRASVGLRDVRRDSPTNGVWSLFELTGEQLACVIFPRGILHGWYFHKKTIHLQAVSEAYNGYEHDDNLGCHWADPDLEIPWPQQSATLAERAATFPSLKELMTLVSV